MKTIYIAAPYKTGDVEQNLKNALQTASMLIDEGYLVYCPQFINQVESFSPKPYSVITALNASFIKHCDAVLRLPGESVTADSNVDLAKTLNIPVYLGFAELNAVIEPVADNAALAADASNPVTPA